MFQYYIVIKILYLYEIKYISLYTHPKTVRFFWLAWIDISVII